MLRKLSYRSHDEYDSKTFLNIRGLFRTFLMFLRGGITSIRLSRVIFLGRGAHIEHVRYLNGRGILKLEEYVTVQGVSSKGVYLGSNVSFGAFSMVRPSSQYGGLIGEGCHIEAGTTFGPYAYLGCGGFITIGKNCMFGPRVSLIAENHIIPPAGHSLKQAGITRKGITIGNDCWIGANVVILDGSVIGDGAVIAGGAVVRGEIPPNAIAAGVPARVVKNRL